MNCSDVGVGQQEAIVHIVICHSALSKYDFPGVETERCAFTTPLNCVMASSFSCAGDVYRASFSRRSRCQRNLASKSRRHRREIERTATLCRTSPRRHGRSSLGNGAGGGDPAAARPATGRTRPALAPIGLTPSLIPSH